MILRLNKTACAGHALCNGFDPDLFPLDDDGYSVLQDREVSQSEVDVAHDAVQSCPEGALFLDGEA